MQCPTLSQLPPPPSGKVGWPWTEESQPLTPTMPDGRAWPLFSVITPSYNQARYLEATLRSILLQGYPNIELFVMDGGSNDGSVEIIKKYSPWISHWVSERDGGQSAAINRGLTMSSGLFTTWINSDDMLSRNAVVTQAEQFGFDPGVVYVGDCQYVDQDDRPTLLHRGRVHTFEDLVRVREVWRSPSERGHIVQPEVIFPRQMAMDVGALDVRNHRTMDYELWGKFFLAGAKFRYTKIPFARFRVHAEQKTGQIWSTTQSLVKTAAALIEQAPDIPQSVRQSLLADLEAYEREYWQETGPLARLGLPHDLVISLRDRIAAVRGRVGRLLKRRG